MYAISLTGSLLLIMVNQIKDLKQGYVEVIIFIVQLGISSNFVTINVAVLVLVSVQHRMKIFAMLQTINVLAICCQPRISTFIEEMDQINVAPTYLLIGASSLGLVLGVLLSHRAALKANSR